MSTMEVHDRRNERSRSRYSFSKRNRSSSQRDRKSYSRSPLNYFESRSKSPFRSRSRSSCNSKSRSTYSRSRLRSYSSDRRRNSVSRSRIRSLDKSNRCLGIFGLDCNTNERKIYRILSKYGTINRVNIIMDARNGKSRGFGFAYFKYIEDARKAKEKCSGMIIDGQKIRIDFSFSRRNYSTRGVYMGRNIMRRGSVDRYNYLERYDGYYRGERYDKYNQDKNYDYIHKRYRNERRKDENRERRSISFRYKNERRKDEDRERRSTSFRYKYLYNKSNSRSSSPCRYA